MTPHFFCNNIHNFEEKESPIRGLCLHCFYLKINEDPKSEVPCECGCKDVCPECDGERFCDYGRGEDESIEGCQICNSDDDGEDPDAYDRWRDDQLD